MVFSNERGGVLIQQLGENVCSQESKGKTGVESRELRQQLGSRHTSGVQSRSGTSVCGEASPSARRRSQAPETPSQSQTWVKEALLSTNSKPCTASCSGEDGGGTW